MMNSLSFSLVAVPLFLSGVVVADPSSSVEGREKPKIILNQDYVEGWYAKPKKLDLTEPDDVFFHVFSHLPDEVMVYPGENYYYWKLVVDGREIWGNIRLPAGSRDRGVVSFGYAEFNPFPSRGGDRRLSRAKYFTRADGVVVEKKDHFTYLVTAGDKAVTFRFNKIDQHPPTSFKVRNNERFIQRTFDESGMQFFLMFNTERNYFFWVLDEEVRVPDSWTKLSDEVVVGARTGFVFWMDPAADKRKVLATIRKISVLRNDYYDGPFDQLSDNYVEEINIKKWMELAIPGIKGRIDKYGYYTDSERPSRVALSNYGNYYTFAEALKFVETAKKAYDPYLFISRGGVPPRGKNWDGSAAKKPVSAKPAVEGLKKWQVLEKSPTVTFDDAAIGKSPAGWDVTITGVGTSIYTVEKDDSGAGKPQVLKQSGIAKNSGFPLCIKNDTALVDGHVGVKFKPLTGKVDQAGGVVWRYADKDNYYICRANALEDNVVLYKVEKGKRSSLEIVGRKGGYGMEAKVPGQEWSSLRVEFKGSRFKVILNGNTLFEVEDGTFSKAGKVGLWTKADSVTLFDNFSYGNK